MRNARKLVLLAVMALAAMALTAPTAFGQLQEDHETLELKNTTTGVHCPAVNMANKSGGCLIHAKSEPTQGVELRKHVFGIESHITTCDNEFTGRVNEDAEGYIGHQLLTGASCVRQPCKVDGVTTEWPAHGDEAHKDTVPKAGETGVLPSHGHREVLTVTFCVEPIGGGADESCETSVPFNQTVAGKAEFGTGEEIAGHGFSGFRCELIGHWETEHTSSPEGVPPLITITHVGCENKAEVDGVGPVCP
jgi:hypothetical protein